MTSAADGSRVCDDPSTLRGERNAAWVLAAVAWSMAIFMSAAVFHLQATIHALRSADRRCVCMPEIEVGR